MTWRQFQDCSITMLDPVRTSCLAFKPAIEKGEFIMSCTVCRRLTRSYPTQDWNLRNSVVCSECNLSGRERHVLDIIAKLSSSFGRKQPQLACFESVTLFATKLRAMYPGGFFSEYVSNTCEPGEIALIEGMNTTSRHEDITNTSYLDSSIDLIAHRDIYEHIPSIKAALNEAHRILTDTGSMIFTMPLYDHSPTRVRCEIVDGSLIHHLEPAYHGNPISKEGSLVFNDPGIDFFNLCEESGFDPYVSIGYDVVKGYFPDCNPFNEYHSWNICIALKKISG